MYVIWKKLASYVHKKHIQTFYFITSKEKYICCVWCSFHLHPTWFSFFLPYFQQSSLLFVLHCWKQFTLLCFSLKNVNSPQRDGDRDAINKLRHDWSHWYMSDHGLNSSAFCIVMSHSGWLFFWARTQPTRIKPCWKHHLVFPPLLCCYLKSIWMTTTVTTDPI